MKSSKPQNEKAPSSHGSQVSEAIKDSEGRVLLVGFFLAAAYMIMLGWSFLRFPDTGRVLIAMTTTNVLFGRATGMSFGYAGGLGDTVVILVNMFLETIQVLLAYPLFVLSWNHLLEIKLLKKFIRRMHRAAVAQKNVIQKYGIIGLFIFVWIPFWMTGPVVGSIIGYLIGLRLWVNLTIVLGGTYVAILGWALLIRKLHNLAGGYGSFVPMVLVLGFILLIIIRRLYLTRRTH